jgi:ubiquinone/menaquinone biosynthesis C-methylase UbiE
MQTTARSAMLPPTAILKITHADWACRTLCAAVELELFEPMKEKEKGTSVLLDAMVAIGMLDKSNSRYRLSETARIYLLKDSKLYLGQYISTAKRRLSETWDSIVDCVRTGKPANEVNKKEHAEQFFPELAAAIFPLNYSEAQMTCEALQLDKLGKEARVLDVAAGTAVWSIPIAESHPSVRVDALDFPAVIEVAKEFTKKFSVHDKYRFLVGDWRSVKLERESYDVVIIGHLLHSEGEAASRELLSKLKDAIKPGGKLVVAEFMPNDERSAPPGPVIFAVNMFLHTTTGCVFSYSELKKLIEEAGFHDVVRLNLPYVGNESSVVAATRT